jgi:hypothetical protein
MRSIITLAILCALVAPVAALADGQQPTPASTATQTCKQEQTSMGATTFGQTYGTNAHRANAFGKCVSKHLQSATSANQNAAQSCKVQQADPNFAAAHGGMTFDQVYGTNTPKGKGAGKNAFGKCVSQMVSQAEANQAKADTAAAHTCKAARKSDSAAFAGKWGSGRNAFGKCVSSTAKTK